MLPSLAAAQWRCDCTTIVDSCAAEVSLADEFIEVTTDTNQCARVDYFVDGRPFVAVVTEGRERQDFIPRSDSNVLVQSCQVCRDNAGTPSGAAEPAADAGAASGEPGMLEPLIEVVPAYPEAAQAQGASGYVEVRFTVLPSGGIEDVSVVESEPGTLFDAAAVEAVRRWRYPPDQERAEQQITERLEFSPRAAAPTARPAPADDSESADTAASGPVNTCVREDSVYNFGEMVEVTLINACSEPLAVHACAQGVGPRQGRWDCTDARAQRLLLVPRSDTRVGDTVMSSVADGLSSFAYGDAFVVTRAPNTQYWWLACRASDTACQSRARDWLRAVDGQLARIDPQQRSPVRVARSY